MKVSDFRKFLEDHQEYISDDSPLTIPMERNGELVLVDIDGFSINDDPYEPATIVLTTGGE